MIRLIASDIDGTLLTEGRSDLNPAYFDLIRRLRGKGVRFCAASGRQYPNLRRLFAPVADEIDYICENGSLVISAGHVISKTVIQRQDGEQLLRVLLEMEGCEPLLSGVETCYIQPKDSDYVIHLRDYVKNNVTKVEDILHVPEDFLKIAAYFKDGISPEMQKKLNGVLPKMRAVVSGLSWMDFLPDGCNKGTALAMLQTHLNITRAETMSFGDNENDIELLCQSGIACRMRNGHEKLRQFADQTIDDVCQTICDEIPDTL